MANSLTIDHNAADHTAIFEADIFNDLKSEGDEFFTELVDMFIKDVPIQLENLAQTLSSNDGAAATRIAHTLKGTAATFGATQMQGRAGAIEQACHSNSLDQARALLEQFRSECERVRTALALERAKMIKPTL